MLGALVGLGLGCALMRNPPRRRRRRARRNPQQTIHAASRLDRPLAKIRTACGMPLLDVYDYSPFAEEATCPACRAATAADPSWWRPKRSNPRRRSRRNPAGESFKIIETDATPEQYAVIYSSAAVPYGWRLTDERRFASKADAQRWLDSMLDFWESLDRKNPRRRSRRNPALHYRHESEIPADLVTILSRATPTYEADDQSNYSIQWRGHDWGVTVCAVVSSGDRCDVTLEDRGPIEAPRRRGRRK